MFVPLWPTTPFILLAAICYSRGSERFHRWIYAHKVFGPALKAWEDHGVISVRAKAIAVAGLIGSATVMWIKLGLPWGAVASVVVVAVLAFLLTRSSREPTQSREVDRI